MIVLEIKPGKHPWSFWLDLARAMGADVPKDTRPAGHTAQAAKSEGGQADLGREGGE